MAFLKKLSTDSFKENCSQNSETSIFGHQEQSIIPTNNFDDEGLIELHKIHGNKWKKISSHFSDKNDSYIKNHFYSLLRRSLRKLNGYINYQSKQARQHKLMKLNFVFKLTNLAESERSGITNKNKYQHLLYEFLKLKDQTVIRKNSVDETEPESDDDQYFNGYNNSSIERLLNSLREIELFFLEHNLNKKGKSKKKCPKKLELKKDIIQRSLSLKQEFSQPIHGEIQHSQSLNLFPNFQQIKQDWEQMLSFDHYESDQPMGMMMDEEASFDPMLFQ